MSDEFYSTPEDDRRMLDLLHSAQYIEGDGQMHPVSYGGDADEDEDWEDVYEDEVAGETMVDDHPEHLTSETVQPILDQLQDVTMVLGALDISDPLYRQKSVEASGLFLRLADGLKHDTDPILVQMQVDAETAHQGIEAFLAINLGGLYRVQVRDSTATDVLANNRAGDSGAWQVRMILRRVPALDSILAKLWSLWTPPGGFSPATVATLNIMRLAVVTGGTYRAA